MAVLNECRGYPNTPSHGIRRCDYSKKRGADFVSLLGDRKLFPTTSIAEQPLNQICSNLRIFLKDWKFVRDICEGGGHWSNCGRMPMSDKIKDDLAELAAGVEERALRLCFKCAQEGTMQKEGKCEKNHVT